MGYFFILYCILVIIPVGIFFYKFFNRILLSINYLQNHNTILRLLSCGIGIVFSALCINIFSITTIVVLHFLIICLIVDIINLLFKHTIKKESKFKKCWTEIYKIGLLPVLITSIFLGFGYYNMNNVIRTEYNLKTTKKIENPIKICLIADLHSGTSLSLNKLQDICNNISKENCDAIILDGDIFDQHTSVEILNEGSKVLGTLKSKYGTYFVYGNHDKPYEDAKKMPSKYTLSQCENALINANINILQDKSVLINDSFYIIGREALDFTASNIAKRESIATLTSYVDKSKYLVLADHQPVDLEKNASYGIDLQVGGHTHGGQIWPAGIISNITGLAELVYGKKTIDNYNCITTSGISGWGYPIRTEHHSEYVIINITN